MGVHTNQSCLYNTSPDSLLYQEMLSFKASQAFSVFTEQELEDDDGSDWEILQDDQGEYYDGGSETSPSSSSLGDYSDDDFADGPYSHRHSPYAFATTSKRILRYDSADSDDEGERGGGGGGACLDGRIRIRGDVDLQHSDDEIEVGFHSRRGNTNPPRNGTHGGHVAGGQPNPSSEDTRRPAGAVMRRGQRTIVVHPTLHPQEKVAMTTTSRALQCQNVRSEAGRELFGQSIIIVWQHTRVQSTFDVFDPGVVKIVKDTIFHTGPVVYGHQLMLLK